MIVGLLRAVSLRHARRSPGRSALVVCGIGLGVALFVGTLASNRSLVRAHEDTVSRLAGPADLVVSGTAAGIPFGLVDRFAEIEGVAHAAPLLEVVTRIAGEGETLLVLGVDFLGDPHFLPRGEAGALAAALRDPFPFVNSRDAILLSRTLAERRGLGVGDAIEILTAEGASAFRIHGLLDEGGVLGLFGGRVAVLFLDAAQRAFGRGDAVDRIDVAVAGGADPAAVLGRLEAALAGAGSLSPPALRSERLARSLLALRRGLALAGLVALLAGGFLVFNAVSISVAERRREHATLRALGMTRARLGILVAAESLPPALLGSLAGLAAGRALAQLSIDRAAPAVARFFAPVEPPPAEVGPDLALAGLAVGTVTALAAALGPALRAARLEPAQVLRTRRTAARARELPRRGLFLFGCLGVAAALALAQRPGMTSASAATLVLIAGVTCTVPTLVLGIRRLVRSGVEGLLGAPGRIGMDDVARRLGRGAPTVAALGVAAGFSIAIAAWVQSVERPVLRWIDRSFPADVVVTAAGPLTLRRPAFAPDVLDELRGIEGADALHGVRLVDQEVGGVPAQLLALDAAAYLPRLAGRGEVAVLEGPDPLDPRALVGEPALLLSENLSRRLDLHAGERVALPTPGGERWFRVHGVVVDYLSQQGVALVDRRWYERYWGDPKIDAVYLYASPGADPADLASAAERRLAGRRGFFVAPVDALRGEIRAAVHQVFSVSRAPELVVLVIALVGVASTMVAAVLDRVHEIGILRAIGATRPQVVAAMVTEAAFLGLAAAAVGALGALPEGWILTRTFGEAAMGWRVPYSYPLGVAGRVALWIVATAAAAGLLPARRAASLDVRRAIAAE
jgi:putative ABC transport system permease protein